MTPAERAMVETAYALADEGDPTRAAGVLADLLAADPAPDAAPAGDDLPERFDEVMR